MKGAGVLEGASAFSLFRGVNRRTGVSVYQLKPGTGTLIPPFTPPSPAPPFFLFLLPISELPRAGRGALTPGAPALLHARRNKF